jgi:hypothetical protein
MLAEKMDSDIHSMERTAKRHTERILKSHGHTDALWSVNLVDVYVCPRTNKISHTFQIAYCSETAAVGRTVADSLR